MALGLPQWLPLTDAEEMIATHLAAEVDAMSEDELLGGGLCRVPGQPVDASLNGNGRLAAPELELDLDCWQVQRSMLLRAGCMADMAQMNWSSEASRASLRVTEKEIMLRKCWQ